MAAAGNVAQVFDINIVTMTKAEAGANAKAPAVYLNDRAVAEIGGIRDGKISEDELVIELASDGVPKKTKGIASTNHP
jgi:hypothetical protein